MDSTFDRFATSSRCCAMKQPRAEPLCSRFISCWTPSGFVTVSFYLPMAVFAAWERLAIFAPEPAIEMGIWRTSFLRSHETFRVQGAPLGPLLAKELAEILAGRALWTMLLLMCPLIGYSFFQALSLYGEASAAALQSPAMASSLSPLDGVLVPTLGASYVAITLLFPFVAIRVLGQEKESGALRLLIQLPYRTSTLIAAKVAAVLVAWVLSSIPAISALAVWRMLGGHLSSPET